MMILVTGGAGFIGSHLTERLLTQGHRVVVADNFLTGRRQNLSRLAEHPRLTLVEQDLSQPLDVERFRGPFDRIYNLASPASPRGYGKHPIKTQLVNSLGTYQVLSLAQRDGARFLQTSTSEVYGDPLVHPQPETYWGNVNPIGPRACYDEGKRFAETLVTSFVREYDLDARIARIFNTYGPHSDPNDGRVVPNFCVQALRGEPLTVYGDGSQTRSFCYVDDLVRGLMLLMETDGLRGEVVNLGNPAEITVKEFAAEVIRLTGSRSELRYEALPVDDPTRRRPDITKATALLGWRPEIDLSEGVRQTVAYFAAVLEIAPESSIIAA